jgi:hypothetical protein
VLVILNFTRLSLLAMWFGAALFFSVVVAPAAFSVLRSFALPNASEIAGSIVTRSLAVVNVAGFAVGLILLITLVVGRGSQGRIAFMLESLSVAIIILGTGLGYWVIAAKMAALRIAMSIPVDQVPVDDPRRVAFNSLHGYSVKALGLAMIAALIAMVLISRRQAVQ